MSVPSWHMRILAMLQLALVLPPMVSGSICIPLDRSERPELGYCVCAISVVWTAEAAIGTPGTPGCGPCRDQLFSAVRVARPATTHAQVAASPFTASCLAVLAPPLAESQVFWAGEPPGARLPVLRCWSLELPGSELAPRVCAPKVGFP